MIRQAPVPRVAERRIAAMETAESQATRSAIAVAGANFALVKYWGKRDTALNLPAAGSISLTLEALTTETRVEFRPDLEADALLLDGSPDPGALQRAVRCLDRLREMAGSGMRAEITSHNHFPTGAGLASSASGFAALVTAAAAALDLDLDGGTLSGLARQGSGSAARSIFGGFVEMQPGRRSDGADAVAVPLQDADAWPLEVVVAITAAAPKAVSSTDGMEHSRCTSPYYRAWLEQQPAALAGAREAIARRNFEALAEVSEASALAMHAVAMASRPGLVYFNAATVDCIHRVRELRQSGIGVFFTVDAGPQVKAVCQPGDSGEVAAALAELPGVERVIVSRLGPGARVVHPGGEHIS